MPSALRVLALSSLLLPACSAPAVPSAPESPRPVAPEPPPAAPVAVAAPEPAPRLDDETWFPYGGLNLADRRGTALDASDVLDAPAGKHGALGRQGDAFVFADGRKVRFWGTTLLARANFPSPEQAEFMSEFCAQLGFNLTWHVLPGAIDAEQWQRFDLLIARLIQRGVHIALDLERGAGEDLVRDVLAHHNPHTGKRYAEDPAVVLIAAKPESRDAVRAASFRGLVVGSDWTLARARWDGPQPSLKSASGLFGELARQRDAALPLLGHFTSAQAEFRNDAPVMMAAYAGLHGFSLVAAPLGDAPFAEEDQKSCRLRRGLECEGAVLGLLPALARLVHRRHVKESPLSGAPVELAYVAKSGSGQPMAPGMPQLFSRYVSGSAATSVTGELMTDFGKGLFKLDTPRSQGVVGITLGEKESVSNLSTSVKNRYATVLATSLDDRPLARSSRILISAVGNAVDHGGAPLLIEPMVGSVELNGLTGDASDASVHYLSVSGQRLGSVPIQTGPGIVRFEMDARYRTLHYELVRGERSL